jgi:rhodanese-related sulfurtransferase
MLGSIPSSVNVPLSNFEKALDMDESDFLRAYGFRKPKKDQKLVFYCKAGVRAGTAAGLAKDKGWKQVRNYPGSYDEVRQSAPPRVFTSDACVSIVGSKAEQTVT